MTTVPARNPLVVLACVLGALCLGPGLGIAVAARVAPGSEVARVTSPLAFCLTLVVGLVLWFGIGATSLAIDVLLARGRWRGRRGPSRVPVLPGSGSFVPLAVLFAAVAGAIAGLTPEAESFWGAWGAHVAAGAGYGGLLRALARRGYLPFPEPS